MKKLYLTVLTLAILLFLPLEAIAGPLGFDYGMTKDQIRKLVGDQAIVKSEGISMELKTAPKPYPGLEAYVLYFSPSKGLLKIVAIGKDISTSADGSDVRASFEKVQSALTINYGAPKDAFDFLKAGSIWDDPHDFMMGLIKKDRVLSSDWLLTNRSDHIDLIAVEARALSPEKGYLMLIYEFDGWNAFVNERNAKANSVL